MRTVRFLILSAMLVACAGSPDATECKTGITCPEGTKCAAAQAICIINDCGDAIVQASEECDDGNILDGDGCKGDCLSREACGDGVVNAAAGELCDDGNTTGGDGCAADCLSVEICGNGIRDVNEVCDDGGTVPGDGCSGNCLSNEVCGNGIKDINEKCDDGGDPGGCNPDCQGGTGCGDGAIDRDIDGTPLEECDDGNDDDFDDCHDCHLNYCGDGIVRLTSAAGPSDPMIEECDGTGLGMTIGVGGETGNCNLDCTVSACGDNRINNIALEECDDGASMNAANRDCTDICHINVCGDLKINTLGPTNSKIESCDDGNSVSTDGCSTTCKAAACGNGVREGAEACDDGGTAPGDGCNASCQFERCGDGLVNDGEMCDGDGTGTGGETSTCNIDCTMSTPMCGDGKINKAAGEQCDDQNINDSLDQCRNNCKLNVCGDGSKSDTELCDDNPPNTNNADGCTTSCTTPTCRNGILEMGEVCDDGNNTDTDGCRNNCMVASCGDGVVKTTAPVEECDPGSANIGVDKNCVPGCKINICGDGFRDQQDLGAMDDTEACDDGNAADESVCPYGIATCTLCKGDCSATEPNLTGNVCGDGTEALPEMCDDGNALTETNCAYGAPNGMCMACDSTCLNETARTGPWCGDGTVQGGNGEACDDRSATQSCGRCSNACGQVITAGSAVAATGVLIASDNSGGNISDGDTLTLSDGLVTVKFEFDKNAAQADANAVLVDVNAANMTATQVRTAIKTAIDSAQTNKGLHINYADIAGTSGLTLTNTRRTSLGNQPIGRTGLGANFFTTAAMSGGIAGDCLANTPCESNEDCLGATGVGSCTSHLCVTN